MSSPIVQSIRRRQYFWIGTAALCLLTLGMMVGVRLQTPMPKAVSFWWSVVTGSALLSCILYQWTLLIARISGHKRRAARHYQRHRKVGTAAICLFLLHAGGIGYALLTVMASVFLLVSVTGLLNSEVSVSNKSRLRRGWNYLHVALSGLLLPLVAFHIWAALAFK